MAEFHQTSLRVKESGKLVFFVDITCQDIEIGLYRVVALGPLVTSKNVVPTPLIPRLADMTGFEKDCLESHNEYREKHGVPPLKWNQQLKEDAQRWANILAQRSRLAVYLFLFKGEKNVLKIWQTGIFRESCLVACVAGGIF